MSLFNWIFKSEKHKAIFVVSLVIIALSAAFFNEGFKRHSRTIDQNIIEKKKSIQSTVKNINLYLYAPYKQRLSSLLSIHNEIPKIFMDRDRDTLYRHTLPIFEALERENKNLDEMQYHLPDGRSFLRMGSPEKFGDDLRKTRPAVQHVHQIRTPLTCYEIGNNGVFFRIIYPVFYQGSYAGVLELGVKVHAIVEALPKQILDSLATFFMTDRWQKVTKPLEHEPLIFGKHILITHNNPFYKYLPSDLDLSRDNQHLTIGDKLYLLHAFPLFNDFQGKVIGGLVVMQDISRALTVRKNFIFQSVIFTFFLLAISLIVLYLTFGKLIGKLEHSKSTLKKMVTNLGQKVEERKQTEMQLYESEKEWERTFDAIGDIVTIMDSKFRIIKANQATYNMFNVEPGTLMGKLCHELFDSKLSTCSGCPCIDTIKNCQVCTAEIEHKKLGKSFLITTSPVPDKDGKFSHIVHIAKDITEKKEFETKLRQSQKLEILATFAAGATHELATPLGTIAVASGEILQDLKDSGTAEGTFYDDILLIREQVTRCKGILYQMAADAGEHMGEEIVSFSIREFIDDTLALFYQTTIKQIEVDIQVDDRLITMPILSLCRVLRGILKNSIDASEAGEPIFLSCHESDTHLLFEVRDQGEGMDDYTLKHAVDPFFTTKSPGKGMGLGLYLAQSLANRFGGDLQISSSPASGTTVTLSFAKEHIYF